jgi:hypothetical protein
MKNDLSLRRVLIRTCVTVILLMFACLVCNILGQLFLPIPNE